MVLERKGMQKEGKMGAVTAFRQFGAMVEEESDCLHLHPVSVRWYESTQNKMQNPSYM
jgi:hypothetical protein